MAVKGRGVGPLRERVAFDKPVTAPKDTGGMTRTFVEQFSRSAQFIYQRGDEEVLAGANEGTRRFKVRVASSTGTRGIRADWRMRHPLREERDPVTGKLIAGVYNVVEVDTITSRAWVYLVVESGVAV